MTGRSYPWLYYGRNGLPISREEGWALLEDPQARKVEVTDIGIDVVVSTVFLVIDHNHYSQDPNHVPLLFETMIFGGEYDMHQWRFPGEQTAVAAHALIVRNLTEGKPPAEGLEALILPPSGRT